MLTENLNKVRKGGCCSMEEQLVGKKERERPASLLHRRKGKAVFDTSAVALPPSSSVARSKLWFLELVAPTRSLKLQ